MHHEKYRGGISPFSQVAPLLRRFPLFSPHFVKKPSPMSLLFSDEINPIEDPFRKRTLDFSTFTPSFEICQRTFPKPTFSFQIKRRPVKDPDRAKLEFSPSHLNAFFLIFLYTPRPPPPPDPCSFFQDQILFSPTVLSFYSPPGPFAQISLSPLFWTTHGKSLRSRHESLPHADFLPPFDPPTENLFSPPCFLPP